MDPNREEALTRELKEWMGQADSWLSDPDKLVRNFNDVYYGIQVEDRGTVGTFHMGNGNG